MTREYIQSRIDAGEFAPHTPLGISREHGSYFVSCNYCGATWSVHRCTPGLLDFDLITSYDDEACIDREREEV